MSNKVYVKKVGESGGGELGTFYFEFVDNYISKQIEVHGTASFFLDENHPEEGEHMLEDQPLDQLYLDFSDRITAEEFYQLWNERK